MIRLIINIFLIFFLFYLYSVNAAPDISNKVLCLVKIKGNKAVTEVIGDVISKGDDRVTVSPQIPTYIKENLTLPHSSCGMLRRVVKEEGSFYEETLIPLDAAPAKNEKKPSPAIRSANPPQKIITKATEIKKSDRTEIHEILIKNKVKSRKKQVEVKPVLNKPISPVNIPTKGKALKEQKRRLIPAGNLMDRFKNFLRK